MDAQKELDGRRVYSGWPQNHLILRFTLSRVLSIMSIIPTELDKCLNCSVGIYCEEEDEVWFTH